jgi:hypothetical protein
MAGNDEERALRATAQLQQVVQELRAFLTAALAAELQASVPVVGVPGTDANRGEQ